MAMEVGQIAEVVGERMSGSDSGWQDGVAAKTSKKKIYTSGRRMEKKTNTWVVAYSGIICFFYNLFIIF